MDITLKPQDDKLPTLKIADKYENNEELKKSLNIAIGYVSSEINFVNYCYSDIRRFRKILHTIIDYKYPNTDNKKIHEQISNNNFTIPILLGIVEVVNR
nr:MAG TPA: hypothetical protein [Bacteriophage sp.]